MRMHFVQGKQINICPEAFSVLLEPSNVAEGFEWTGSDKF